MFYGFNRLSAEFEGMTLKAGDVVTPELVSCYFRTCDRLFRKHFNLEANVWRSCVYPEFKKLNI